MRSYFKTTVIFAQERRLAEMDTASLAEQKQAHLERIQSQSFDELGGVIEIVEDDNDDDDNDVGSSKRSSSAHSTRFRKSVAFFIGSDVLRERDNQQKQQAEHKQHRRSTWNTCYVYYILLSQ